MVWQGVALGRPALFLLNPEASWPSWSRCRPSAATSLLQVTRGLVPGVLGFAVVRLPIAASAAVIGTITSTRSQPHAADGMRGRLPTVDPAVGAVGVPLLGRLCERIGAPETLVLAGR